MNPEDYLYLGLLVSLGGVFIYACYIHNATKWWLCPICLEWHNNIGEKSPYPPTFGRIMDKPCEFCPDCARRNIDQL